MWSQQAIKQQILNLIGRQNLYSYTVTVMMHACGKLVMWLSRAVISLARGSSSAQAQGFCPSSLDPWRWGRGTRLHACILEIVKGSGLLDQSIEQIIHMECCIRIQGIIVFGLQPSVRDYPALKDLENEPWRIAIPVEVIRASNTRQGWCEDHTTNLLHGYLRACAQKNNIRMTWYWQILILGLFGWSTKLPNFVAIR